MLNLPQLIQKYSVPVPRYTSYPTVPYWEIDGFTTQRWITSVQEAFEESNQKSGISLYIHLPYCESLCTYCGCNTRITKNHQVEKPYIKAVAKEWQLYKRLFKETPIIKELHLGGGTPTFFSPEHLKALIEDILEGCTLHPNAEFSFEAHPANTTQAHLETLYALGFRRLSLGIQDFDEKVQHIINRIQTEEQVKTVTQEARSLGYSSINYDLIYGLPLQTLESLVTTMLKVVRLKPDRIAFYNYAHVPWLKPGQRMFTEADLPQADLKQQLYETGRDILIAHGYHEIGMDHFALKTDSLYQAQEQQHLHRNFMGYTHQYTQLMIGLGVSSISDTWFAFAQNVKKVEDYLQLIEQERFPVFKGHFLNEEDVMMRTHILEMMCKGKTSWSPLANTIPHFDEIIDRLAPLAADGLIELERYSLKVTPLGKRFLRNICAAFDLKLHRNQPQQQIFSLG
ncbi:oxygen-independent coproporphyrinogen III oxidase [Pelobium sp.]|nr:oxygen-independent coproporphyrinogen III oxidase [Pelobium sp.]MDA9555451.1 oxygen-independent coproporphyrinogen III oxidase [Pelobium sp.]